MKLKSILLTGLSFVLVTAVAIGGTLAYLTSTDDDVNVMTLGNVSIAQHEYQRVQNADGTYEMVTSQKYGEGYKLQPFTQAKPLYPATGAITGWGKIVPFDQIKGASGSQAVFAGLNNVQDKFVLVENTGKSDAYVRTLIALEYGSNEKDIIGISTGDFWTWNGIGIVEIDKNNYYLFEAIYKGSSSRHIGGVLPAGEYTYNSLGQVYLKNEATNDDCEALDGNKNGTYDILVFSQAVQVKGFESPDDAFNAVNPITDETTVQKSAAEIALDAAFGDITTENHPWSGKTVDWLHAGMIYNAVDMHKSTTNSGTFILGSDIKTSDYGDDARYGWGYEYIVRKGADYTLDLNGKTIVHDTINENANNDALTYLLVVNNAGTKLTIEGDGKIYSNNSKGYTCAVQGKDGTLITINDGDYQVDNGIAVWAGAGAHIVINGGSFVNGNCKTDHELIYSSGGIIDIYGGFFHNTDGNYTLNIEDRNRATGFINVYGGTYVNFDPSTGGQDPNNIKVADGYKVVSETQANGDVWYTVVAE